MAPDGFSVLFSVEMPGEEGIWSVPIGVADGVLGRSVPWEEVRTHATRLTRDLTDRDPALSPDGSTLAFGRQGRIALLHLGSHELEFVTPANPPFDRVGRIRMLGDLFPTWSPSGAQILYTLGEEEEAPQLRLADLARGTNRQLTHAEVGEAGTHSGVWSPAGTVIAAVRNNMPTPPYVPCGDLQEGHLVFIDAVSGADIALWPGTRVEQLVCWTPEGDGVVFYADGGLYLTRFPEGWGGDRMVVSRAASDVGGGLAIGWQGGP